MVDEDVLDALDAVVAVLEAGAARLDAAKRRVRELRDGWTRGVPYADLLGGDSALVVEIVSELLDGLLSTGSRLRRVEAHALYAEGLTMDEVARLLRVSRQRVSALLREAGPRAEQGDQRPVAPGPLDVPGEQ